MRPVTIIMILMFGWALTACGGGSTAEQEPMTSELSTQQQAELVAEHLKKQDIVITTALIPGRPAPRLISKEMVAELRKANENLTGQGQIQAYMQHSLPVTSESKEFKYQGSDPSMTMQVLEAIGKEAESYFLYIFYLRKNNNYTIRNNQVKNEKNLLR